MDVPWLILTIFGEGKKLKPKHLFYSKTSFIVLKFDIISTHNVQQFGSVTILWNFHRHSVDILSNFPVCRGTSGQDLGCTKTVKTCTAHAQRVIFENSGASLGCA